MVKLFVVFLSVLFGSLMLPAQTILSPEAFLGYSPGNRFTPHYQIVSYFEQVSKNAPQNIKFIEYGKTNENRPLTLAIVSSSENMDRLEQIRESNLQLAKLKPGNPGNPVVIVWLSYNVHGNEPSSSEAAMETLYNLVTRHTNDWLKNTVVIIDPCLNPDGRDRYVNWYNTTVGAKGNSNPYAREHDEPWPGGRVNHYYFDLNRDWAWQTQIETQERIKIYNQWMPQVHVDFHEQGINEPYYFAPAAEPFHEVITPWQKEFQYVIGKNNAKYFDENGWFYFTKERFDLFYPSYGDTYPMYNGSIGMTYEQGGHSRGGLSIVKDDGDTLTLTNRIRHHTTTGLSTVEASSNNAAKLLSNFQQYFTNSVNGNGSLYKSYILTDDNFDKINELSKLFQTNGIQYQEIEKATGSGLNYFTGKTEPVGLQKFSLEVNAFQPKSILAKVLLEPTSKLSDTATYDITAWSLPYAYGIKAYASNTRLSVEKRKPAEPVTKIAPTGYAYFIPYGSLKTAKTLAALEAAKVKLYINEKEITANGKIFGKGTILLIKNENRKIWDQVITILETNNADVVAVSSGFADKGPDMGSPDIKNISAPKIACVSGEEAEAGASGEVWYFYEKQIGYPITLLNSDAVNGNVLKNFDVLIVPDGNYSFISNKDKLDEIKTWVKNGGRLIAMERVVSQLATTDLGLKLKKQDDEKDEDKDRKTDNYNVLKKYENRDRDEIPNFIPGAIFEVQLDATHPLAFGYGNNYYTLKQNGTLIEFNKDAWNVGVIKKNNIVSGFAGYKVKEKIKDGTVIAVQNFGRGSVIYFVDDPIFRNFWQNGKLIFFNAAFLVGNNAQRL
jgi:hypothetical protein